jgi:hypothetical protein
VADWRALSDNQRLEYERAVAKRADPAASTLRPDSNFGVITEAVEDMMKAYLKGKKGQRAKDFKVLE